MARNVLKYERLLAESPKQAMTEAALQRPNVPHLQTRDTYEGLCQTLGSQVGFCSRGEQERDKPSLRGTGQSWPNVRVKAGVSEQADPENVRVITFRTPPVFSALVSLSRFLLLSPFFLPLSLQPTHYQNPSLYCSYETNSSPYLLLQPVRKEVIHLEPYVALYHDFVSDLEAHKIRELAEPWVSVPKSPPRTFLYGLSCLESGRVRTGWWKHPHTSPVREFRMAEEISGHLCREGVNLHLNKTISLEVLKMSSQRLLGNTQLDRHLSKGSK